MVRLARFSLFTSFVVALAFAGSSLPGSQVATAGGDGSGGRAVAHHGGGKRIASKAAASKAPDARLYQVGKNAIEPTMGLTKNGELVYTAFESSTSIYVMRSADGGRTWDDKSPKLPSGQNAHRLSLDPYIWVDPWTGRIFNIDLTVACSYLSFTDDLEIDWTTNPLACGRPVNDHQSLFGGPPVTSDPIGYDNLVYYCWNDVATSSCSKSTDGGITFAPTGSPAFHPADDAGDEPVRQCGGLHGHGVVGHDGTVYLPKEHCEQPWLSISRNEGQTWTHVRVAKDTAIWGPDPSVAVDKKGNIYYVYVDEMRMPRLTYSRDEGKTWSKPMMIAAPGLTETVHATLDVGKPGAVAVAYYGTDDVNGKIEDRKYPVDKVAWDGFLTISENVFADKPLFYSGTVNDPKDPFTRGDCGPRRCQDAVDFIDVVISRSGIPYGAFADSCTMGCVGGKTLTAGVVGSLVFGPRLR
ncbi:MAG TPA: sialidase family protein [Actinomycetota bacterium]|nr:sialidase family protein [Actinomycetota bacterium]